MTEFLSTDIILAGALFSISATAMIATICMVRPPTHKRTKVDLDAFIRNAPITVCARSGSLLRNLIRRIDDRRQSTTFRLAALGRTARSLQSASRPGSCNECCMDEQSLPRKKPLRSVRSCAPQQTSHLDTPVAATTRLPANKGAGRLTSTSAGRCRSIPPSAVSAINPAARRRASTVTFLAGVHRTPRVDGSFAERKKQRIEFSSPGQATTRKHHHLAAPRLFQGGSRFS